MTALRVVANLVCVLGVLTLPGTFYRGVLATDRVPLVLLIPIVLLATGIRLRQMSAPLATTDALETPRTTDVPDGMAKCPHCHTVVVPTCGRTCPACRQSLELEDHA